MQKIIIANWKMNLTADEQFALARDLKKKLKKIKNLEMVVAPDFLHLAKIAEVFVDTNIKMAAQDVAIESQGALTGEVAARAIKEVGCGYALVGHSERRIKLREDEEMIRQKLNQCYAARLVPILCIGETGEEKLRGDSEEVLPRQLRNSIMKVSGLPENELVIAYEPVWAIGQKQFLDTLELAPLAAIIKRTVINLYSEKFYNEKVRLVYGGSVSSINASSYWQAEFLDGLLIGSASLDAEEFCLIAQAAENN